MELAAPQNQPKGVQKKMQQEILHPIGKVTTLDGKTAILLEEEYAPALAGLESFGCVQVIWWFSGCDNESSRSKLTVEKPYRKGPDVIGTFATRSPERPNPIALSSAFITGVDRDYGILYLAYLASRYLGTSAVRRSSSEHIKLLDMISLGQDKAVAAIKVGDKQFLLGVTQGSITKLSDLDEEDIIQMLIEKEETPLAGQGFKDILSKINKGK